MNNPQDLMSELLRMSPQEQVQALASLKEELERKGQQPSPQPPPPITPPGGMPIQPGKVPVV